MSAGRNLGVIAACALGGAALGIAAAAWGQGAPEPPPGADPGTQLLLQLVREGGLPAVLALACGLLARGIPLRVSLSDEDRSLLRRLGGTDDG